MNLVKSLQSHSSTCLPMFIEDAAIVAVEAGMPLMKHEIAEMDKLRLVAIEEFRKVPGLKFVEPQGAFYVFLDFRGFLGGRYQTSMELCDALLSEAHVAIVPGEAFGAPWFCAL